ncbi:MAG: methionyl-tRNA formyltransferase, partial [Elusimicrobia bacterium]|nr:methionyl-tRNA formyltransferase [Elusimicrobiota bacterium]MBD3412373.1 methionyl-tRNA formyltransferase [Elusimicrobiota bacterium]
MKWRTVFWGSSPISVPFVRYIHTEHELVGVVTRPDKPAGRGHRIQPTPVSAAVPDTIPVLKPRILSDKSFVSSLQTIDHDFGLIVAYGKIIPEHMLSLPRRGLLNVHFSLLPKYRGPAPIQHALLNGEKQTGVSIFKIEKDIDTGPLYAQQSVAIDQKQDDYHTLADKLIRVGIELLNKILHQFKQGTITEYPQSGASSYAPLITKQDAVINWHKPARIIRNTIAALVDWPTAQTRHQDGRVIKILKAECTDSSNQASPATPGQVISIVKNKGFIVQ